MSKISNKYFTMIELFIVVAIIGILVTILFPALVNTRHLPWFQHINVLPLQMMKLNDYTTNSMNLAENDGFGNVPLEDNTSRAHKIPQIPLASETAYLIEVNQYRADARANNYDNWDVWNEDKTTYKKNGDLTDQTHFGTINVTFIDGHVETRRLNQSGVPFSLFLPNF